MSAPLGSRRTPNHFTPNGSAPFVDEPEPDAVRGEARQGCLQSTDLAPPWHAMEKGATFVTYDQGLKQAAGPDWSTALVVLKD